MSRLKKPSRRTWWFTGVLLLLIGAGSGIWWGKARALPEFTAEASAAYSRGDWERTALLARERLLLKHCLLPRRDLARLPTPLDHAIDPRVTDAKFRRDLFGRYAGVTVREHARPQIH